MLIINLWRYHRQILLSLAFTDRLVGFQVSSYLLKITWEKWGDCLFVCLFFVIFITLNFCFVICVNANYLTSNNFVSLTLERITGVIQSFFYKPLSLSIKSSTLPKIATGSPLGTTAELCCNNLFVYVCVHACVLASVCA